MIAFISGRLLRKTTEWVVIDVSGVGYRVFVSQQTLSAPMGSPLAYFWDMAQGPWGCHRPREER